MKNPVAGRVKTRLAASIGDEHALKIYLSLLDINRAHIQKLDADIFWYINEVPEEAFQKQFFSEADNIRIQEGENLGEKMSNAFQDLFDENYEAVGIMGTDCPSLSAKILEEAFLLLESHDFSIGPAEDGGYYFLAMRDHFHQVFDNVEWSTSSVLEKTLQRIKSLQKSYKCLETLSDIDDEADARKAELL